MRTRSKTTAEDSTSTVTAGVKEIRPANSRAEEKVESLSGYISLTQVGPLLSCLYMLFTDIKETTNALKGLEAEVQKGFTSLQSQFNDYRSQTESMIQRLECDIGWFTS
jgi:hypothetical protein